jgi:hypothetical protein
MRTISFKSFFYFALSAVLIFFGNDKNSWAAVKVGTALGIVSATVVEGAINLGEIDAEFNSDISLNSDRSSLTSESVSQTKIIDTITSKPRTKVNISYGEVALSSKNEAENKMGYATLNLINEDGVPLKVKIRADRTELYFDKSGRSELKVESEFFPTKKQPNGTYRGTYYIIMSH